MVHCCGHWTAPQAGDNLNTGAVCPGGCRRRKAVVWGPRRRRGGGGGVVQSLLTSSSSLSSSSLSRQGCRVGPRHHGRGITGGSPESQMGVSRQASSPSRRRGLPRSSRKGVSHRVCPRHHPHRGGVAQGLLTCRPHHPCHCRRAVTRGFVVVAPRALPRLLSSLSLSSRQGSGPMLSPHESSVCAHVVSIVSSSPRRGCMGPRGWRHVVTIVALSLLHG